MNLDALTNSGKIRKAVNGVKSAEEECSWMLLGYVDEEETSRLMTIEVEGEGKVWKKLLYKLKDDRIQYAYAKMEFEDITKLFLIHWIGKKVNENLKESCMPHLNEVRNLIPTYDLLVCKMDILEVQAEVQSFFYRKQSISVHKDLTRSRTHTLEESQRTDIVFQPSFLQQNKNSFIKGGSERFSRSQKGRSVKVAIIGRAGVGKTFIYLSYQGGGYALTDAQGIYSTISPDRMTKDVTLEEHSFTLEIWDTAGQERFAAFAPVWTRHAKVVICVYDITDEMSYNEIPKHIQTAKQYADPKAIFFLVGNKADLVNRREVGEAEGEIFASEHGMTFMECSGLTGLNILNLFENITREVVFKYPDICKPPGTNALTMPKRERPIRLQPRFRVLEPESGHLDLRVLEPERGHLGFRTFESERGHLSCKCS